ncbi:MAG: beta-propeller fold lactonase family protein [Chloracidobacterium sp.]|nr:beta-propeller fold lactonase family protein [Chloracidobacterium sp.]
MKRQLFISVFILIALTIGVGAMGGHWRKIALWAGVIKPGPTQDGKGALLPTGWKITPAGQQVQLPGDMVMKIVVSPDGKTVFANTAGWHDHSVNVVDAQTGKIADSVNVAKVWAGMAINPATGAIFVSGGGAPSQQFMTLAKNKGIKPEMIEALKLPVVRLQCDNGKLAIQPSLAIEGLADKDRFVAGVTYAADGSLYVVNTQNDAVYRLSGADFKTQVSAKVGYHPYAAALAPNGRQLAVSNWGDESVSLLDPATLKETARVKVGSHPNDLAFAKDGRLFVANAGSNSLSVIRGAGVIETIKTSFDPKARVGSTPASLAITSDGKRLYAANADNNDVAVIDISNPRASAVLGFIPTTWYPSAVAVSPDGKKIYVGSGKGGLLNLNGNFPAETEWKRAAPNPKTPYDYVGSTLTGTLSIINTPDKAELAAYSAQVKSNFPNPESGIDKAYAEKITKEVFPKIKHVLYIIRENRTYDQVFGDLGKGNGDPELTLFGENVTPNAHKIARESVILDNLYCNGEVSQDGHQWSNAAYATDFTQKAWVNSYSSRGEPSADERLTASPAGYLWDNCKKHGKTYRSYGEFASFRSSPDSEPKFVGSRELKDHVSVEWLKLKMGAGRQRDTKLADVFIKELHEAESRGEWWDYMVMSLGEDHTSGLSAGTFTPSACVGSNDLALGMMIEAITKSKFWPETAIFIIEDDAQNGPDHVDARRTVGLVYSPYVKRGGVVDSTMYTTVSYVRTMELILGLPPMTQYDELATPMYDVFTPDAATVAYVSVPARTDLMARNPATGEGARRSARLDFSDYDRADFNELNDILWKAIKGDRPMPSPVRSALLGP